MPSSRLWWGVQDVPNLGQGGLHGRMRDGEWPGVAWLLVQGPLSRRHPHTAADTGTAG